MRINKKNVYKNKYKKECWKTSVRIPVQLLNDFNCIAEFLDMNVSELIIASMSLLSTDFNFSEDFKKYNRYTLKSLYRKEQSR